MKKQILGFMMVLCFGAVNGQNNSLSIPSDTLVWKVSGFYNTANQETVHETGRFILNKVESIEWIQDAGEVKYDFTVVSTTGTWTDLSKDGRVTFEVQRRNRPGTIVFMRSKGKITVQLTFIRDNKNVMPFVFEVIDIEKK